MGFAQDTEVRYYFCQKLGDKKPTPKRKREEWYPQKVQSLQDMINSESSPTKKARFEKKLKTLRDRSYRVLKLNQEMEEALHATEEPPPLTDYTLEQEAMVQEIRNKTYLIKYQGRFSRHSLLDKDVTEPQTCKTLNTRYCEYCRVEIDLHVWVDHIRSL